MLKQNKLKAVISSIVILLPMLFGIIIWDSLPDIMATHFGASGNADGFSGKGFVVFGMPLIFLAIHWLGILITSFDKKQKEQTKKAISIIFWIIPITSLFASATMYSVSFDKEMNLAMLIPIMLGLCFIFMGNYMPKIKQNRTLGIKISWALRNEENWNKTHRFGGKVMVLGGFILLFSVFLPLMASFIVLMCVIVAIVIAPTVYSYLIYKEHQKQGIKYNIAPESKAEKGFKTASMIIVPIILIGIAVLMFTGSIETNCKEDAIRISATYWSESRVDYSIIDAVEYRTDFDSGVRTNGFASAKLLMGIFKNEEFGKYTLYSYAGAKAFVVLTSGDDKLVIGLDTAEETKALYDKLLIKIGEK